MSSRATIEEPLAAGASVVVADPDGEPARPVPVLDGIQLVPPRADSFMDPRGYFSPAFFDLEMHSVFPSSWIFVCDLDDVSNPGDYVTETIGYEPVVVLRGSDGELRALSNVCSHRASTIVEGSGNCGKTLTCPYHGWSYLLDGQLSGVPYRRGLLRTIDPQQFGLKPLRVDVWERWVFVDVAGDAPPLREYLEDLPSTLALHRLGETTRVHRLDDMVHANWKVLMDNAFCDYHLPVVHERSLGSYIEPRKLKEAIGRYTGSVFAPSRANGGATYTPMPGIEGKAREGSVAFSVFPNWFVAAFPHGGCTVMWWSPVTIDTTRARVWHYTRDEEADPRAGLRLLQQIQAEDYGICEKVQRGLRSALYRPGPRHQLELRIHGYQKLLMEMLAAAAPDV